MLVQTSDPTLLRTDGGLVHFVTGAGLGYRAVPGGRPTQRSPLQQRRWGAFGIDAGAWHEKAEMDRLQWNAAAANYDGDTVYGAPWTGPGVRLFQRVRWWQRLAGLTLATTIQQAQRVAPLCEIESVDRLGDGQIKADGTSEADDFARTAIVLLSQPISPTAPLAHHSLRFWAAVQVPNTGNPEPWTITAPPPRPVPPGTGILAAVRTIGHFNATNLHPPRFFQV